MLAKAARAARIAGEDMAGEYIGVEQVKEETREVGASVQQFELLKSLVR